MDAVHPVVVHFPIVLLVAAVLLDAGGIVGGRRLLGRIARWALWLGTVSAGLAVWSGHEAGDAARAGLEPSVEALLLQHHDVALWTLGGAALLSLWRLVAPEDARLEWKLVYLILAAALVAGLTHTAHLGGQLVFEHAVGVRTS